MNCHHSDISIAEIRQLLPLPCRRDETTPTAASSSSDNFRYRHLVEIGELLRTSKSPSSRLLRPQVHAAPASAWQSATANLRTKILDFRGFDSSRIIINFKGWSSHDQREILRSFESTNHSRDNLSREIGHIWKDWPFQKRDPTSQKFQTDSNLVSAADFSTEMFSASGEIWPYLRTAGPAEDPLRERPGHARALLLYHIISYNIISYYITL